ncbi:MAG TPA: TetR/AcrR family transcriptional regulator [Ktedonobacterales bacterium]|nr:TetR/AcrR family transcriptional regulator [Ktedonobacterales bacterium]
MDEKHGRARDSVAAREAFLGAAGAIFARAGFEGARVEEIAAKAGYNKALLFHYFGDKLGLYQAVVSRHHDQVAAGNSRVLDSAVPPDDAPLTRDSVRKFLEVAVRWSFDFCRSQPTCARVLSWEAAEGWTTLRHINPGRERPPWIQAVQRFLLRARDAGFLRADLDPNMLVAIIAGMAQHYQQSLPRYEMLFAIADLTTPEALAHAREQMVQFVVRGAMTEAHDEPDEPEESEMEGKNYHAAGI